MTAKQICDTLGLTYVLGMSKQKLESLAVIYASFRKQILDTESMYYEAADMGVTDLMFDDPDLDEFDVTIAQDEDDPFAVRLEARNTDFTERPIDKVPTLKALKYSSSLSVDLEHSDCVHICIDFDLH